MKFLIIILLVTIHSVLGDDILKDLQNANTKFTASLYQQIIKDIPGQSIVVSPLSVQLVFALTQLGAKGETVTELTKGLHLPDSPEKVKEAYKLLLPTLTGNQSHILNATSNIHVHENYTVNSDFQKLAEDVFDAGLRSFDFDDVGSFDFDYIVGTSETFIQWASKKNNEKIHDMRYARTILFLLNGLYLHDANWSTPFDNFATTKRTFHKSEKEEVQVDTMQLKEKLKYAENKELDARFLELPYKGDEATFTIVLPNQKEGLSSLEAHLSDVLAQQNYSYERVNLYMPKFEITSLFKLVPALKELGINKAHDVHQADLSGLLADGEILVIKDVVQIASINVTETGTGAAAATAIPVADPLPIDNNYDRVVKADRPFLFYLTNKKSKQLLFLGRYTYTYSLPEELKNNGKYNVYL